MTRCQTCKDHISEHDKDGKCGVYLCKCRKFKEEGIGWKQKNITEK